MKLSIITREYLLPEYNVKSIMRYLGIKQYDEEANKLLNSCMNECKSSFTYKACYSVTDVKIAGDCVYLGNYGYLSKSLSNMMNNCDRAVIFAATVGMGIDRLITKYNRILPSRAYCFQAIGTERVEALCDCICHNINEEYGSITPRFSPGYGDLDMISQKNIFNMLDVYKYIGVTLNTSCSMSPSKSVTAIIGIKGENIL